jgi:hypothetical protein
VADKKDASYRLLKSGSVNVGAIKSDNCHTLSPESVFLSVVYLKSYEEGLLR